MHEHTEQLVSTYQSLLQTARDYAVETLVPLLSKEVLEYGNLKNDQRSILELCHWSNTVRYTRETTPEYQLHCRFTNRLTVECMSQALKINNANYPYPELISMMLEQCDYWEIDAPVIVEWAVAYLEGKLDDSGTGIKRTFPVTGWST